METFNIEEYLDSLPEDTEEIRLYNKKLTYIPESIIRFKKLKELFCYHNQIQVLPDLPQSLTHLYCWKNEIRVLPVLTQSLTHLYCGYNRIQVLPVLPQSLIILNCCNNQIQVLPVLPQSLISLDCTMNEIVNLPLLPPSLIGLYCYYHDIFGLNNLKIAEIRKLQALKTKIVFCKYKAKFIIWMWRARQRIAEREWHPDRVLERIEAAGGDLEHALYAY